MAGLTSCCLCGRMELTSIVGSRGTCEICQSHVEALAMNALWNERQFWLKQGSCKCGKPSASFYNAQPYCYECLNKELDK